MSEHFAGCPKRAVKSHFWNGKGTVVTLECGHSHFTGAMLTNPTARLCLEGPCYRPGSQS